MTVRPDWDIRVASFFQVLHPLELLSAFILAVAPWVGIPIVPAVIAATAIGFMGALLRRAWAVAALWAALSTWLAAGAPGLLSLVIGRG